MTDDRDNFPGARDDTYGRQGPAPRKPALWRRLLWGVVRIPAAIVNAMLGNVR